MKTFLQSYFAFTRSQRSGLLVLSGIIVALQLLYWFVDFSLPQDNSHEKQEWLSMQSGIDALKKQKAAAKPEIYPFNPNFITDFKGYRLGMSVAEIDRLLAFRKENRYVNSAKEFQSVTKVSDSLLAAISPYFKFPDWVKNKKPYQKNSFAEKKKAVLKDINTATKDDLMAVYGIGPALSDRILKMKDQLGGFTTMDQMQDVWGLSPEVVDKLKDSFKVTEQPAVKKIAINDASVKELSQFPYFRYALAKEIVTFRSMNGRISGIADLVKIKNFPVEKVEIIAVYLEF